MPYRWEPAELFYHYNGVNIYHTYRHDQGDITREYWYGLTESVSEDYPGEDGMFDIRELAAWRARPYLESSEYDAREHHQAVLRIAINRGELSRHPDDVGPKDLSEVELPGEESHYQWKQLITDDDGTQRLINAQADPYEYEHSIGELLFQQIEAAYKSLETYGCVAQAIEERWVLTRVHYIPIRHLRNDSVVVIPNNASKDNEDAKS